MIENIYIDADSCPRRVRDYVAKRVKKLEIHLYFVANKEIPTESTCVTMIVCPKEKDSADNFIFENAKKHDIVITKDILLASRLVEKNICAMNDRGTSFTKDNIRGLLKDREFNLQLSQIGFKGSKQKLYSTQQFLKFTQTFEKELNRLLHEYW